MTNYDNIRKNGFLYIYIDEWSRSIQDERFIDDNSQSALNTIHASNSQTWKVFVHTSSRPIADYSCDMGSGSGNGAATTSGPSNFWKLKMNTIQHTPFSLFSTVFWIWMPIGP